MFFLYTLPLIARPAQAKIQMLLSLKKKFLDFKQKKKKEKKKNLAELRNHFFVFLLKLALKILNILFPVPV